MIKDPRQAFDEIERLGLMDEVMDRCLSAYSVDVVGGSIEKAPCDRFRVRHGAESPWTVWSRWELFEYSCRHGLLPDASVVCAGLGELLDLLWDKAYWMERVSTVEAEISRLSLQASEDGEYAREVDELASSVRDQVVRNRDARRRLVVDCAEKREEYAARRVGEWDLAAGSDSSNLTGSLAVTDSPSQESVCNSGAAGSGPVGFKEAFQFVPMMQGGAPDDLTAAAAIVEKNREKWQESGQSSDENELRFEIDPEQVIWRKRDICYGPCRWKDFSATSLIGVYCWSLDRSDTRLYQVVDASLGLVNLRTSKVAFGVQSDDFFKKFCLIQPPYDSKELAKIREFPKVDEELGQSSHENDRSDKSDRADTTGEGGGDHAGLGDQVPDEGAGQSSYEKPDAVDFGFELPSWPVICRALSVVKQSTVAMAKHSGLSCEFCAHLKIWLRHMTGARTGRELLKFSVFDLRCIVKDGLYSGRLVEDACDSLVAEIADLGKPKVEIVGRPASEVVTVDPEKVSVVEKKIALPTLGEPTRFQFAGISLADKVRVFKKGGVPLLHISSAVVGQFKKMLADHPLLGDAEWCRRRLEIWADGYKLTMLEGSN